MRFFLNPAMGFFRKGRAVALAFALSGCSLAGGRAPSEPGPMPAAETGDSLTSETPPSEYHGTPEAEEESDIGLAVVETALGAIGTPYRWGGTGANGFDCSGLIRFAYGEYGIEMPRISRDQVLAGSPVELRVGSLRGGDVLGFSAEVGGGVTHVGLYIGDGRFIHSTPTGVRISDLREPHWQRHFVVARRIVR